ncbi:MCE family protein [Nocardia brasiliensis]|uniref:MCE family protein n=1 Tax=Nocardia brasiliensis TaxID=37326 RepID=A0A6G9Y318_NOCBR|nr:MCE family protein [Nocardia brasiliensis]
MLPVSSCGIDASHLALPGTGVHGPTYRVHIQFADALNLPSNARVMANGAQVGRLRSVTVADPTATGPGSVLAEVDIERAVPLPAATIAQLRQDTILGDVYIGLDIPTGTTTPTLEPGDTIPIAQTKPALQIEDVLSAMATFVSGGALHAAQDIVNRVNTVLPADPAETARIADVLKNDLIDIAADQDAITAFLDSIDTNARLILDNRDRLDEILTPHGVVDITEIARSLIGVVGVIGALGGLAHALAWIAPLATQGDAAARAFVPMLLNTARPLNLSAPSNLNALVAFLRDKLIPWSQRPAVNVLGVHIDPADPVQSIPAGDQIDRIVATLRMIGMVR